MNIIFSAIIIISFIYGGLTGNINAVSTGILTGAEDGIKTIISISGIICFWSGLLKVGDEVGICNMLERLLSPLISKLFKNLKNAKKYVLLNICANILGMGNAATPMGIKAMNELDDKSGKLTDDMCLFTVLNSASFQLIPSTIIAIRCGDGSVNPFSVILPIWITSFIALSVGIICVRLSSDRG